MDTFVGISRVAMGYVNSDEQIRLAWHCILGCKWNAARGSDQSQRDVRKRVAGGERVDMGHLAINTPLAERFLHLVINVARATHPC